MDKKQSSRKDLFEAWNRYLNDTCTCDDLALVLDSIMDDVNVQEFNDAFDAEGYRVMTGTTPTPEERKEAYRREAAKFLAEYKEKQTIRIDCGDPFVAPSQSKIVRFRKLWYAAAAAAILLGIVIPATYLFMKPKTEQIAIHYVEESTQRGEIRTVVLPDQTKVTLNAGSRLKYPVNFTGDERSVELYGEALFDVTSDPERPFTVKTENMNIKVLGTVFDVKEYADDLTASVSVVSGKVEVGLADEKLILVKNQQVKMDKTIGTNEKMNIDAVNCMSWTNGILYFNRTPIREVFNTLNRYYPQVDIDLAEIEYNSLMFTGKYKKENHPDNIIKGIAYTLGLKHKKTGNKYVLYKEELRIKN